MKKFNFIVLTFFLLTSCIDKFSNKHLITFFKKELSEEKQLYMQIAARVMSLNKYGKLRISFFPKSPGGISISDVESGKFFSEYSSETEKILYDFMIRKNCWLYPDIPEKFKIYFIRKYNGKGLACSLINHLTNEVNFQEYYPGYEIVEGENLPKRDHGWVYILENNWIIYSPKASR